MNGVQLVLLVVGVFLVVLGAFVISTGAGLLACGVLMLLAVADLRSTPPALPGPGDAA